MGTVLKILRNNYEGVTRVPNVVKLEKCRRKTSRTLNSQRAGLKI